MRVFLHENPNKVLLMVRVAVDGLRASKSQTAKVALAEILDQSWKGFEKAESVDATKLAGPTERTRLDVAIDEGNVVLEMEGSPTHAIRQFFLIYGYMGFQRKIMDECAVCPDKECIYKELVPGFLSDEDEDNSCIKH